MGPLVPWNVSVQGPWGEVSHDCQLYRVWRLGPVGIWWLRDKANHLVIIVTRGS